MKFFKLLSAAMGLFLLWCLTPSAPCPPHALAGVNGEDCFELSAVVQSGSCVACVITVVVAFLTNRPRPA